MKKTVKVALASLLVVPALALGVSLVAPAESVNAQIDAGLNAVNTGNNQPDDISTVFQTVVNVLLFVIGAVSVIMLIIGGIRYAVSGGDQGAVTSAKNTILYAVIGLVVAFFAFAIVNWIVGAIGAN